MEKLIEIKGLNKSYGKVKALSDIDLTLYKGEIHGLVGTNGSGKSTLLNILFGNPIIKESGGYRGDIYLRGEKIEPFKNSYKSEFGMIHQEFILIPEMSIWENINLGDEIVNKKLKKLFGREFSLISLEENKIEISKLLKTLGVEIDVNTRVENLSTSIKQFIEIAREIKKSNLKILFLDEPTAALNKTDSEILMKILKELAKGGLTIVFISHRLDEVANLCDRLTIIRDGQIISKYEKSQFNIKIMERDMTGHEINQSLIKKRYLKGNKILEFCNFGVSMPGDESKNINLDILEGEIVGITSLSGHGKLSIGYGIGGLMPVSGEIKYCGELLNPNNISKNMKDGIVVLTEDRKRLNLLMNQSVMDNIAFSNTTIKKRFLKGGLAGALGFWNHKAINKFVEECVDSYDIKLSSVEQKVGELSGGNQQKVCIARAVSLNPKLLFIGEPTRGIDVDAKEKVLNMLVKINRKKNTTILVASSEIDELERICDRIIVLYNGEISQIINSKLDIKLQEGEIKYA